MSKKMITNIPCISWEFEYILRIVSLWPSTYNILAGTILWLAWITIIPFQLVRFSEIKSDAVELMTAICDIASEFAAYSKLFIAWMNRKTLMSLIIEMAEDWQQAEIKVTRETRVSCFIARLDLYLYCGAIIMFFPKLMITYFTDKPENREFLLKTSYPFDDYKSPVYESIIVLHFVQGILMVSADLMPQAFIVALVCHVGTQFNILEEQLDQVTISSNDSKVTSRQMISMIGEVIEKHKKNIDFADRIEMAFSAISFIHCLCNGVAIGCSGVVFMMSKDPVDIGRFSIYLLMKLVQTFVLCYSGEYLTNKSVAIADVVYRSNWCNLSPKYVNVLKLVMLRSQKPLQLTAGGFGVLSSGMFTVILKTSGSYMSMLRATY